MLSYNKKKISEPLLLFGKYLKLCREQFHLTQEELVSQCYNFHEDFHGLDIGTLSRWERGVTSPNVEKQLKIVKLLQRYDNSVFPYFNSLSPQEVQGQLCKNGIINLIANSKEHILKFPSSELIEENLKISHVIEYSDREAILKMPNDILKTLIDDYYELDIEILKSWVHHTDNLLIVSEYKGHFFGMYFAIKIKPAVFNEILTFKKELKTLSDNDFANNDEIGCMIPITFFAYNQATAILFYMYAYANLIANQSTILAVGSTPVLPSGVKLVEKINLKKYFTKEEQVSYKASIDEVLLREEVFKIVFTK